MGEYTEVFNIKYTKGKNEFLNSD